MKALVGPEEKRGTTTTYYDGDCASVDGVLKNKCVYHNMVVEEDLHSEVGFLAFASPAAAMTDLFNVSTANMDFTISQDFFSHEFQGVCFCFSSLLCKLKTTSHFLMSLV
ncbi:unnamed protein product [Sphenostylis stenocarpa]|uniref:Uncharacterized protein n=1 Tax=Sphenostylis stenocarpa TaxID=92480 RepID=A0AA86SDJ1_9FABA|nr:unnamed protein product [Sphenostylis stenocarpa]